MDVNTLKEIDLPAFGRRVHIYNGIKELRRQADPYSATSPSLLGQNGYGQYGTPLISPTMSGYEPDTPSTRAAFSPQEAYSPNIQRDGYMAGHLTPEMSMRPSQQSTVNIPPSIAETSTGQTYDQHTSAESARLQGLGFDGTASMNKALAAVSYLNQGSELCTDNFRRVLASLLKTLSNYLDLHRRLHWEQRHRLLTVMDIGEARLMAQSARTILLRATLYRKLMKSQKSLNAGP